MGYQYKVKLKIATNLILLCFAYVFYYTVKIFIPIKVASGIGYVLGYFALSFIPTKRNKEVLKNIIEAFPNKSIKECKVIFRKSCGNFGQVIFEMPKTYKLLASKRYVKITDEAKILDKLSKDKLIFFSCHMANWQAIIIPFKDSPLSNFVYKKPANKGIDFIMKDSFVLYSKKYCHNMINLDKNMIFHLTQKFKTSPISLTMLMDQRIKEGINTATFFGRPVVTSHFLPMLAIRYNIPFVPIKITRHSLFSKGPMFSIAIKPPIFIAKTGNNDVDVHNLVQQMNNTIEGWVRENPEQWFWLHRRW